MKHINHRLIYLILSGLVVIGIIALIAIKGPLAPVEVQTATLRQGKLQPSLFGVGTVEARRSYTVGPTHNGNLKYLLVDHGDSVKAGQLLGQMDPVDLPDKINSARLNIEKYEHLVEAAQAHLDEANSRAAQARRDDIRYRDLVKKKQVSHEAAEAKATDAITTVAQVHAAQAELDGSRHDLQRLKSDFKALQAQLDELKLISPVTGLVTAREVEPGSLVVSGTPVLRLIDPTTLWVRVRIEQRDSTSLVTGLDASIVVRNHADKALQGKVVRLELIADSLTEERWVDVAFASATAARSAEVASKLSHQLAIGMLANVTILLPTIEKAQWLPAAALQNHNRHTGVWVMRDGKAHFVIVKTGIRTLDGKIQILSGINATDKVVSYSAKTLNEGQRLEVVNHD